MKLCPTCNLVETDDALRFCRADGTTLTSYSGPTDKNAREQQCPDSLDAMVAAPEHHEVLLENERVRVLDSRIKPGETVPVHTHRWESVLYVLGTSDFIRYDTEGTAVFDSRTAGSQVQTGAVIWSPPLHPHAVKNVGDTEIRVISIELKD